MSAVRFPASIFTQRREMSNGAVHQRLPAKRGCRIAILPTTRLGRWAVWLAVGFIVLVFAWRVMGPAGAAPGFALGLAGGVVGLVAIFRRGERAITVFAAILPLALVVAFVLAELIVGHD
jgi:hypothetical protein